MLSHLSTPFSKMSQRGQVSVGAGLAIKDVWKRETSCAHSLLVCPRYSC